MHTLCIHPNDRVTLSGRGLNTKMREARYGKPVAQKTVRTLPREIRDRIDLGLLSL
jgi:hypothetical protein